MGEQHRPDAFLYSRLTSDTEHRTRDREHVKDACKLFYFTAASATSRTLILASVYCSFTVNI